MRPNRVAAVVLFVIALSCTACRDGYSLRVTTADDGRVLRAMVGDELHVDLGTGWNLGPIDAPQFDVRSRGPDGVADIELRRIGEATLDAEQAPPLDGHWELTVVVGGDPAPIVP